MRGGIKLRITVAAMVVVTIVLFATGVALLSSQRRILTDNLDEILATNSSTIEQSFSAGVLADPLIYQGDEEAVAQIVDANGVALAATENFRDLPPLAPPGAHGPLTRTIHLPTGDARYRLLSRPVGDVTIHTATPIDDIDESVSALRRGLLIAIPTVAVVLGLLIWWLVSRTLRPVEAIRSRVAVITTDNLHQRVPEPSSDDEIARLARTMNSMLDRVEQSTKRERRFVADAAHELRSPLTRMRSELEVDVAHPATADPSATHRSVLDEVVGLQHIVDDLLHLARTDNGAEPLRRDPVDLDDLLLGERALLRSRAGVAVDMVGISSAQVLGDRGQLARAVRNLCDNAVRHAATKVTLATRESDGTALITVEDDGPGIPIDERSRIFERFARLEESRSTASGGTGLGLAIARDIINRHGGTITIEDPVGGGTRFVISLTAS